MKPILHTCRSAALLVLPVLLCSTSNAQLIPGVTTTTNMGTYFSYNILDLTNGSGLSSLDLQATHSSTYQDMWLSNRVLTGQVDFDLGSVYTLNRIGVWNYNAICCGLNRAVQFMDVYTSTTGSNFTLLSSETMAIGTGQPIPAHIISANGVQARYVRFDILQNHGNSGYTGLSEVQFEEMPCSGSIAIGGTGCADSGGVVNTLTYSGCPDLGTTLTLELNTSASATGPLFLVFGLSDQNWGGIVLPLDLGLLGAPGCFSYVSQEFILGGLVPTSGQATVGLAIPASPFFVGATSYLQFFQLDPGLNPLSLATSDYLTVTIG